MQSRRDFFRTMVGGVAMAAAARTWPFRVYSLPSQVQTLEFTPEMLRKMRDFMVARFYENYRWIIWSEERQVWIPSPARGFHLPVEIYNA